MSSFQFSRDTFTSSLWVDGSLEERLLWFWLIGNADPDGVVRHREEAIADCMRMHVETVKAVLAKFAVPDPGSPSEGARIKLTDGGFVAIQNWQPPKEYDTPRWRKWKTREKERKAQRAKEHKAPSKNRNGSVLAFDRRQEKIEE